MQTIIKSDYSTYSGIMLERYFKQQFAESFQYRAIGSWWEPKGNQNEIDIIAPKLEKNQAVAAVVKRQKKKLQTGTAGWESGTFKKAIAEISD